jgi:hypothetical protein
MYSFFSKNTGMELNQPSFGAAGRRKTANRKHRIAFPACHQ